MANNDLNVIVPVIGKPAYNRVMVLAFFHVYRAQMVKAKLLRIKDLGLLTGRQVARAIAPRSAPWTTVNAQPLACDLLREESIKTIESLGASTPVIAVVGRCEPNALVAYDLRVKG